MHSRRAARILAHLGVQHNCRAAGSGTSAAIAPYLTEIAIGDSASQWANAGFYVHVNNTVDLGNLVVRLRDDGRPDLNLGFGPADDRAATVLPEALPAGVTATLAPRSLADITRGSCTSRNANAVGAVAELVLFSDDVASFVGALAGCGIATAKGRPPRAVKAAPEFVMARYFLQPQLRMLILGPGQHRVRHLATTCYLF